MLESKIKLYCKNCEGTSVFVDAELQWDAEKQQWKIYQFYPKGHWCDDCEDETVIVKELV